MEKKFNRISLKKLVDLLVDGYIFLILATIIVQESFFFFYFKTKCLQSDCKSNFSYFISFHCWVFFYFVAAVGEQDKTEELSYEKEKRVEKCQKYN